MGRRIIWALVSGGLFAWSLAPHNAEFLGWIAFVPLLWAACAPDRKTNKPPRRLHAFALGMTSGVGCGVLQVGIHSYQAALTMGYVPYLWIGMVLGGVALLAGWVHSQIGAKRPLIGALFVGMAGVLMEYATTFTPLPVGVALNQAQNVPLLQMCAFTGIWGVSFLLWFVNASAAFALFVLADLFPRRAISLPALRPLLPLLAVPVLACAAWGYGAWHLQSLPAPDVQSAIKVAAIQDFSGVDAHDFAPEANLSGDLPDSEALIKQAASQGAQLIVGTENAWGAAFAPDSEKAIPAQSARDAEAFLVVGYEQNADPLPFNCAALIGPNGKTVGVHHKLRLFLGEKQAMQAGGDIKAWNTPLGKIGLLICFDTCYTGDVRRSVQAGAQIIAVPNYDPPTPGNSLHNLHAALLPFRAVENNVAIVRADPNGRSQIIDPEGRTIADSPMFRAVALVAPVALGNGKGTFFTRFGDWLAYLCVFGVPAFSASARATKKAGTNAPAL